MTIAAACGLGLAPHVLGGGTKPTSHHGAQGSPTGYPTASPTPGEGDGDGSGGSTPKPTATPTAAPTVTPTPKPTATTPATGTGSGNGSGTASGASPSGEAIPTGTQTIGGRTFTPTMSEDFTRNAALGSFTSVYGKAWGGYTGVKDTSGHGLYSPDQVLSVQDSTLDWYLHSSNGQPLVAAPQPTGYTGQTYGAYSVRYRTDAVNGYKTAFLLWPTSNVWNDGEIDWPDGNLGGAIYPASAIVGSSSGGGMTFDKPAHSNPPNEGTGWHTATFTWSPGLVQFYFDGAFVGQTSNSAGVPTKAMRWVLQVETSLDGSTPAASASGHVQVDWVVQYALSGQGTQTQAPAGPSRAASTSFARAAYTDVLGRTPAVSDSGVQWWVSNIMAGVPRGSIASGFTGSDEYRNKMIVAAYQTVLERSPDLPGQAWWLAQMRAGNAQPDDAHRNFLMSDEFFDTRGGGTAAGDITALYRDVLDRDPDASGMAFWTKVLRAGGQQAVVNGLWYSDETLRSQITSAYQDLLGRTPSTSEQNYWLSTIRAAGPSGMRTMILSSAEYWNRASIRFP